MQDTLQSVDLNSVESLASKANSFNINKLQAVMCIAASATVSISLIAWAFKTF